MAKRAIVVIHGIGQAQPYEMARTFAAGLFLIAQERGEGTPFVAQIIPSAPQQPVTQGSLGRIYRFISSVADDAFVDVYEAYWAPLTTGMTNFLGIVWWLLINTFIPTRLLRRPSRKTVYDVAFTGGFLAVVVLLYYGLFGALLLTTQDILRDPTWKSPPVPLIHPLPSLGSTLAMSVRTLGHLLRDSWGAPVHIALDKASAGSLGSVLAPITLGWLIATVVGVYGLFQFLFRLSELVGDLLSAEGRAVLFRSPWRPVIHVGVLLAWGCVYLVARGYVTSAFFSFGYIYIVFQLANLWIKKYFVDYIGDIEVYVTRDSKSARFVARDQIRSRTVNTIKTALISSENYAEVLVFGHSLGSVIGLDAIRELRRRVGGTLTAEQFNRLTSFVTFGSPLEKTRFFFERVSPDDPGPWLDFLDEVQATFRQDAETRRIYWTNCWYFADVVANSLDSYNDADFSDLVRIYELPRRGGRLWVHSDYAIDDQFLTPVYKRLIKGAPQVVPQYVAGNAETIVIR